MRTYRIRLFILGALTMLAYGTIIARLYYLQVVKNEEYTALARQQQNMLVQLIPRRGDILDRNHNILATSHFSNNIYLDTAKFVKKLPPSDPRKPPDPKKKAAPPEYLNPDPRMVRDLASLLAGQVKGDPATFIQNCFKQRRRHLLVRMAPKELEEEMAKAVVVYTKRYEVPREAFVFEQNSQREYPKNSLASHIIGYTNLDPTGDNLGKSGIERSFNESLKGSITTQTVPISRKRTGLAPLKDELIEATYGNNVVLTIDEKIQSFTENALISRVGETQALGGIAIVMDVPTGEILALASCPDFNINDYNKSNTAQLRNRTLTDPIEIGSVMKMITTTLLIDRGLLSPDEEINCQHMHGIVDGRRFTDTHDLGVVPFRHAFAASSNIALATVGLRLEPAVYYAGLQTFGLGQKTGVDLPGEGAGVLYPLERWTRLSRTSLPIGYESMMTALEVISAIQAVGNDGLRLRPHIVKEIQTHSGQQVRAITPELLGRVARPETCATVRDLMHGVMTLPMGTGFKLGGVPGFEVGAKTGTSVKSRPGETPKRYIASFAGLLPINKPRLAIYIYVDEPQGEEFYGGSVAGPVFREVALYAADVLGIPLDHPEAADKVKREIHAMLGGTMQTSGTLMAGGKGGTLIDGSENNAIPAEANGEGLDDEVAPEELALPRMPDCLGKTIPEACQILGDAGITTGVTTMGAGLVTRQEPGAGDPIRPGKEITLIFTLPSESDKTSSATEPSRAKLVISLDKGRQTQ